MDYVALKVAHDEKIIKRYAVAGYGITPAYNFRIPYVMVINIRENDTSNGNDITLDDRDSSYSQLSTVLHEALAGYENVIAYRTAKCSFLSTLIHRPSTKLECFNCPQPQALKEE